MRNPHVVMFGGGFTFVQDWARAAAAAGAEVSLVYPTRRSGSGDAPSGFDGVTVRYYSGSPQFRPSRYFWPLNDALSERSIRSFIAGLGVNSRPATHLHTHFYPGSHVVARVADDLQLPLVHTEHSGSIIEGRVSRLGRLALLATSAQARAVFAVSEQLADAMRELGVLAPIRVVPNPVDHELFGSTEPRAQYPPKDGKWRFVTIGWLVPGKVQSEIIKAFARVKCVLPGSILSVIGDGLLRAELEALRESLGLADSVRFLGRLARPEIAEVFAESHCYVHASESETFGVALVEAWAAGLPVVTYECGGISGLADTIGGEVVGERNHLLLAEAMIGQTTMTSLDHRVEVRRRASDHFAKNRITSALAEAYGVIPSD